LAPTERRITKPFKIPPFLHLATAAPSRYSQYWGLATTPDHIQVLDNAHINSETIKATDAVAYAESNTVSPQSAPLAQVILTSEQYRTFVTLLSSRNVMVLQESGTYYVGSLDDTVDIDHPERTLEPMRTTPATMPTPS